MDRVIFQNNPLIEVILQFRFPTILSINSNEPVDFQEAIRKAFPIYQVGTENSQEIQLVASDDTFLPSIVNKQQNKNYAFITANGKFKVNLTSSFVSFSTVDYTRWEEFWGIFENALTSFICIYQPAFFERIGLRYIDAISKVALHLENKTWKELIKESWLGPLAIYNDSNVPVTSTDSEFFVDDKGTRLKIHTGLGSINNSNETVFIVDTDFIHIGNISIESYSTILTLLHDHSKFFIEHVISDELYAAMEPRKI